MAKKKLKFHISRWWSKVFVKKKYKDELFRKVFQNKKDLLDLYNAVSHTAYTDPDALEITTIDSAIYMSMKNDLSFMIGSVMNLYEHQSTFNPNMPLRGLSYFARLYETYLGRYGLNVYGSKRIPLPNPQYLVFYNGRKDQPDEQELKLSDAFVPPSDSPVLECRVRMLNISLGRNTELMQSCHRLWEYAKFIDEVNRNLDSGIPLDRAVNTAIDTCISQDILKDILVQSRSEVLNMFLTHYDYKLHLKNTFEEGRELGLEQGRELGLEQGRELGLEQGRELGLEQGSQRGQKRIFYLYQILLQNNRLDDFQKACADEQFLEELFQEFKI